jgi:single-stranded DNA-specific DHH superfamily exonuclease
MDVIVTDHHEIAAGLPPPCVFNPIGPNAVFMRAIGGRRLAFFLVAAVRLRFNGAQAGRQRSI